MDEQRNRGSLVVGIVAGLTLGMASPAVASTPTGTFDASFFEREAIVDADNWDWPQASEFRERWDPIDEATPVRVVIGDLRFEVDSSHGDDADAPAGGDTGAEDDEIEIKVHTPPGTGCSAQSRHYRRAILGIVNREDKTFLQPVQAPAPQQDRSFHLFVDRLEELEAVDGVESNDGFHWNVGCGELTLDIEHVSPAAEIRTTDWNDWVYAETLADWGDSLYDDPPEAEDDSYELDGFRRGRATAVGAEMRKRLSDGDPKVRRQAVRALLEKPIEPSDRIWRDALSALSDDSAEELKLKQQVHARYRPVGTCSMDTTPQRTARQYSEVCRQLGDLGCFMQLRLRVINNRFSRVAYSSMAARAHDPGGDGLRAAPIDTTRLLRGLMLAYGIDDTPGFRVPPSRLGQMVDQDYGEMVDELLAMAGDDELDAFNRLTATQVVYFSGRGYVDSNDDELLERIEDVSLTPAARLWVERMEAHLE